MRKMNFKTRYVPCNLCDRDDISEIWIKDTFRYVQCRNCGLVYVNPQLEPSEIEKIYSSIYRNKSDNKLPPTDFINYREILQWAEPYRKLNRFLDTGCFNGYLLAAAREKKWQPYGVEISDQAVQYANQIMGLNVLQSYSPHELFPEKFFDVVVLFDVIEHLSDPTSFLKEIYSLLRPGGGLYIFTPNFNSLTRRIFQKEWGVFFPWHQYYFSPETLEKLLCKSGFNINRIQCFGIGPISRSNPFRELILNQGKQKTSIKQNFLINKLKNPYIRRFYFYLLSNFHLPYGSKMTASANKPEK